MARAGLAHKASHEGHPCEAITLAEPDGSSDGVQYHGELSGRRLWRGVTKLIQELYGAVLNIKPAIRFMTCKAGIAKIDF